MVRKLLAFVLSGAVLLAATTAFAGDVAVTKRGKRFHSPSCALIQNKQTSVMDEQQAAAKGLKPCGKCLNGDDDEKPVKEKKVKKEKKDKE